MSEATSEPQTATGASPLLELRDLRTWFPIRRGLLSKVVGHVKAVDGVSLTVHRGETVGLVGESGCGKTTLGRTLLRLEQATGGQARYYRNHPDGDLPWQQHDDLGLWSVDLLWLPERRLRPLRRQLQMIFQDPYSSLNPRATVMDIVTEGMAVHNMLAASREDEARRLMREVGLDPDACFRYPHEFSGGQRQRLCVARALSLQPEFIVCDEAVSALDVSVQAQVINLLMDLSRKYHLSYLFISHDLSVVRHIADRVAVMYLGQIVESGETLKVIEEPQHPYTQALISAVPVPGEDKRQRLVLEGDVPSPSKPPPGCRFHTRCPHAMGICQTLPPATRQVAGRDVACHLYNEEADQPPGAG